MSVTSRSITKESLKGRHLLFYYKNVTPFQTGCWLWSGSTTTAGYGVMAVDGRSVTAHRIAFAIEHGETPPPDMVVTHECDVKLCVNPTHLRAGTRSENVKEAFERGKIKHAVR